MSHEKFNFKFQNTVVTNVHQIKELIPCLLSLMRDPYTEIFRSIYFIKKEEEEGKKERKT